MKKTVFFIVCATLCLTLSGCGGTASAAPAETPDMSEENAHARAAYTEALKNLLEKNILPDGSKSGPETEYGAMEENQFAVCDVDQDGKEELILLYTTTVVAGQMGLVMGWDEAAGALRTQLREFPLLTFYDNGVLTAGWSHNQGKGGSFWPYFLYEYHPETDQYVKIGSVDAWDQSLGLEGYPKEVDTSGTGFVYYISSGDTITWDHPVDETEYRLWRDKYLEDASELPISYLPLTEENIRQMAEG